MYWKGDDFDDTKESQDKDYGPPKRYEGHQGGNEKDNGRDWHLANT
jgi:hypothetical protein